MAGHSHSANIARRKGAVDQKRARTFNKCARKLQSAVRQGGADPETNLKLRYAIEQARAVNMPKENMERTIKRAVGEGKVDEELIYEGYGPGGVALMVTALSDNRHRTSGDLKHIFEKGGGNMGSPGSVGFLFRHRAILTVEKGANSEDELLEIALEVGAEDVRVEERSATILAQPTAFLEVKSALEKRGLAFLSAELGYMPLIPVQVTDKNAAGTLLRLIEKLDSNEDVQDIYANYEMPQEWLDELAGEG
ncbi:MAG: YebC/PmpR family DNA-binding transcriptional regulator [Planctomycetes bacterium]|nr:YebC/PmpR family DNA-binding transcriptional regulator [Planctomycetota bacterium]